MGFLIIATPAFAAEYYIDAQNGSDSNTGITEDAPWQNLSKISGSVLSAGDTVYLKGEFTPAATVSLDSAGTSGNVITINNWPDETPEIKIINGNSFLVNGNYHDFNGLTFHNDSVVNTNSTAISYGNGIGFSTVSECIFRDGKVGIGGAGLNGFFNFKQNTFTNFSNAGVKFESNDANLIIENNIFFNDPSGSSFGLYLVNASLVEIENNTFYNLGYPIVAFASSSVDVYNNIFSSNTAAINTTVSGLANCNYNLFYNNSNVGILWPVQSYGSLAEWQTLGYDANSLEEDPSFISTTSGSENFYLNPISAAIDTGTAVLGIAEDFDGAIRPQGEAYDIGAYEYATIPEHLQITQTNPKKLSLSWDETCTGCTYTLSYAINEDFTENDNNLENLPATDQEVTGLIPAKPYYWKVKAYNGARYSSYTESLKAPTKPLKVKKIKHLSQYATGESVKIRWKKYKRIRNYRVLLYNSKNKKIRTIKIKKTRKFVQGKKKYVKKTIKNLKPDKKYRVKVRARKKVDETWYNGKFSKRIRAKTL